MTLNHKSHELLSSSLGASWSHLGIWALQTNQWITSEYQGWDAVSIFQAAQWFQALTKLENPHRVSFLILLSSVNRHQPSLTLPGQKKNVAFFLSRKFWKGYIILLNTLGMTWKSGLCFTFIRTSFALGGATSISSKSIGAPGVQSTAALHLITWVEQMRGERETK